MMYSDALWENASDDFGVTFGSHGTCTTTKKKEREKAGHAQNILPDRASSGHVTYFRSKDPTRADITRLPVAHAQNILPVM